MGVCSMTEPSYDILIEDADGQYLRLESAQDVQLARRLLTVLAAQYPGTRLVLRDRRTRDILAETEGY
jgi:hypothetical protein